MTVCRKVAVSAAIVGRAMKPRPRLGLDHLRRVLTLLTCGYVGERPTVVSMVLMVGGGRVRLSPRRSLRGLGYRAVSR